MFENLRVFTLEYWVSKLGTVGSHADMLVTYSNKRGSKESSVIVVKYISII